MTALDLLQLLVMILAAAYIVRGGLERIEKLLEKRRPRFVKLPSAKTADFFVVNPLWVTSVQPCDDMHRETCFVACGNVTYHVFGTVEGTLTKLEG